MSAARTSAALLLALLAGGAVAQTPTPNLEGFALQTYEPPPAGDAAFTVPETGVPGHLVPAVALTLSWAREPLVLLQGGQPVPGGHLVHRQFWAFLQASMGLGQRLLLDVSAPVALYQSGSQYYTGLEQVSAAAFGDVKVGARTPLGALGPVSLAAGLQAWLPTGSKGGFTSDGGVRLQPQVVAASTLGPVEVGGAAGFLWRPSEDRGVTRIGPAMTWAASAAMRLGAWRLGPELYGRYQFDGTTTSPAEGLLGAQWQRGALAAGLAVGTQLDRAPGSAPLRILARVAWRQPPARTGPSDEELAYQAQAREAMRLAEAARLEAERRAAEQAAAAQAAAEAERARLAEEARQAAERARLAADRDGDGVPDVKDACPDQPGVADPDPARNGCLPPAPALVKLTKERLEILQSVQFETNRDLIRPESAALLQEVAAVLRAHPELDRIEVEGHTDAQGGRQANLTLSAKRAEAVKRWLVEQGGVAAARLSPRGYGPDRSIAGNDTAEGRARNRRVEFRIVQGE